MRVGGEQVAQDFAGADRGELVDVADQQQMRSLGDRLDQLVGQDHVHHRGLIDHDQIGVQRVVAVVSGVAAGLQLQQPVNGERLVAGQLRQPLGGPAGGRDQHHGGVLGRRELDDERTVKLLPQPGPPVSTATLLVSASVTASCWPAARSWPVWLCSQPSALSPVHLGERRQPLLAGVQQVQQAARERALGAVKRHQIDRRDGTGDSIGAGLAPVHGRHLPRSRAHPDTGRSAPGRPPGSSSASRIRSGSGR